MTKESDEVFLAGLTHKGKIVSPKLLLPATERQRQYLHSLCQEIRDILKFLIVEKQNPHAAWPWPQDACEWGDDRIAGFQIDNPNIPRYYAGGMIAKLLERLWYLKRTSRELYGQLVQERR